LRLPVIIPQVLKEYLGLSFGITSSQATIEIYCVIILYMHLNAGDRWIDRSQEDRDTDIGIGGGRRIKTYIH